MRNVQMVGWAAELRPVGETKGKTDYEVSVPVIIARGTSLQYGTAHEQRTYVPIGVIRGDGHVKQRPTHGVRTTAYKRRVLLEAVRSRIEYRDPHMERYHTSSSSVKHHEERIMRILKANGQLHRLSMGHRWEQMGFDKAFERVARKRFVRRSGDTLYLIVPSRDARRRRSRRRP